MMPWAGGRCIFCDVLGGEDGALFHDALASGRAKGGGGGWIGMSEIFTLPQPSDTGGKNSRH